MSGMSGERFADTDGRLAHRFVPRDGVEWCDYHLKTPGEVCAFGRDQHPLGAIDDVDTTKPRTLTVEVQDVTERLLDVIRGNARIKVRPLGPVIFVRHGKQLACFDGWEVVCTEHGELTYDIELGSVDGKRPFGLGVALGYARAHCNAHRKEAR